MFNKRYNTEVKQIGGGKGKQIVVVNPHERNKTYNAIKDKITPKYLDSNDNYVSITDWTEEKNHWLNNIPAIYCECNSVPKFTDDMQRMKTFVNLHIFAKINLT